MRIKIKKHYRSIIIFIIGTFFGMFLNSMFQIPMNNFVDTYIFGYKPQVGITLNYIYEFPNNDFLNLTNLPDDEYRFSALREDGTQLTIQFNITDNKFANPFFLGNNTLIADKGFASKYILIHDNGSVKKHVCAFNFITKGHFKAFKHYNLAVLYWEDDYECTACRRNVIYAKNFGNKKLTDFKIDVCMDDYIDHVEGDISLDDGHCIEMRNYNFLPDDDMKGTFYTNSGFSSGVKIYDEKNILQSDDYVEILTIILPNCILDPAPPSFT